MIEEKHMDKSRLENRNIHGIVNKSYGRETTNTGLLVGRPVRIRNKKHGEGSDPTHPFETNMRNNIREKGKL